MKAKNLKLAMFVAILGLTVGVSSCKNEETEPDLTLSIVGTYQGKLTNTVNNDQIESISEVTRRNNYTVEIHCTGTDFDTTFMLELFENGKMMMVCSTGDNFQYQYGHQKSNDHHMMNGSGNWTNWNEHMVNEHKSGDEHYGAFDVNSNKFDYTFDMKTSYSLNFVGFK